MSKATTFEQTDALLARSRSANFYGWVMVVVAALAMVATLPGRTHGLGMITERLLSDPALNLSRSGYGQINLWATLLGSLFCLGIGSTIDRFGIRLTLSVVMFALGGVVLAMTQANSVALLFLAIMLSRGLGQSSLSVVSISIVGKWFDKNVSVPMAVYAILMAGGFIAIALIGRSYADVDWRVLWSGIGWSVVGLAVLLTLVARDRQAESVPDADESASFNDKSIDFTHREALCTPIFWVCSLGISLYGLIVSGVSLFNESILVDQGFPKEVYYESLALGTAVGIVAKMVAGMIGVSLSVSRLLSLALILLGASLVWLTQLRSYGDVIAYVCMSAIAGGTLTVLFFSAWRQLFGQKHLGRIQASAQMMTVLASAFGPLIFAEVREATGSYHPLIWTLSVAVFLTAVFAWFTPFPTKPILTTGDI